MNYSEGVTECQRIIVNVSE